MAFFLAKSDPDDYSIDQLERDQRTTWDGVRNPQALKAIQAMQPGDFVFLYSSGGVSKIEGLAKVASAPRPDPKNAKLTVVDLEFVSRLSKGATLAEIKESGKFADWALVRQPRLSTMAVPDSFVAWLRKREPEASF